EKLRKALEANSSQREAKKRTTGHRATAWSPCASARVPGSVSGKNMPRHVRPRATLVHPREYKVKAAHFVNHAPARPRGTVWQNQNEGLFWNFKFLSQCQTPLRAQFDLYDEGTAEAQGHSIQLGLF
ncbi:hypothetical protein PIB30_105594, partial [Stylosanthes scabra]|nr:hypothetical protein [Stylosanthes scabra]